MATEPDPSQAGTVPWAAVAALSGIGAIFSIVSGLTYPLLAQLLVQRGASPAVVGASAAMTSAGMVAAAIAAPRLARAGGTRLLAGACLGGLPVTLAAIWLTGSPAAWLVIRFVSGVLIGVLAVISETWLNHLVPSTSRGRAVGLYSMALAGGFGLGPLILAISGPDGAAAVAVAVGCPLAALALLIAVRTKLPDLGADPGSSVRGFLSSARALLLGVAVASFAEQAAIALLPLYGRGYGHSLALGNLALTVMIAGHITLLYPLGVLSDRFGRRPLMITSGIAGAGLSALLALAVQNSALLMLVIFLWGGAYYSIYTASLAQLGDQCSGPALLAGNASFLAIWGLSGLTGPPAAGSAMRLLGPAGFPATLTAAFAGFVCVALLLGSHEKRRPEPGLAAREIGSRTTLKAVVPVAPTVTCMDYCIIDPALVPAGPGPHPAASPFDKRVSEALGVRAFEVYQVELPPGESTVRHDHQADRVEDVYAFTSGSGWVVVNDQRVPVSGGLYVAVTRDAARHVQAGDEGLVFTAICAPIAG
jgi:MFS family permease